MTGLAKAFCTLRVVLTKIRMYVQLDDASIYRVLAIQFDFWKKNSVYCVYAACLILIFQASSFCCK